MYRRVAVVTDSTASLPHVAAAKAGIIVVPQGITLDGRYLEDDAMSTTQLADALRAGVPVRTNHPPAPAFFWAYQDAIAGGAEAIVSLHVSGRISRTCEMARAAASQVRVPVHVVDSGTVGMSLGFAALAGAEAAEGGAGPDVVLAAVQRRLAGALGLMYIQTLEYLRRGGRISAARAWMGDTFGIKPVLGVRNGEVVLVERLRGGDDKAIVRLAELAGQHAGRQLVDVAVEHFEAPGPAMRLATRLQARIPYQRAFHVVEISAVLGVHDGPGAIGIAVSPC
jgi:DegV family protein with EDD domain